jgi:hypothetical protein
VRQGRRDGLDRAEDPCVRVRCAGSKRNVVAYSLLGRTTGLEDLHRCTPVTAVRAGLNLRPCGCGRSRD